MCFYRHKLYELIEDNDFEMVFEETTMEDCANVVYNGDEVKEQFDDQTGNFDRVGWSHKVLKTNRLITYVLKQLETKKEVYVSLNEGIMDQLARDFNVQFKEHGFMYRPSKQCFVKYKTPKPKVLKFASKAMQNAIRLGLCNYVEKYLNNKYNTSLEVKFYSSKEEQANYLRLGIANGITQEMIKSTKIRWQGWVEETIYEWGERTRVGSGDLVVQYLEDWWNEVTS